ncbi:alpha/beta fold hydrolase [Cupriavidus pauculus]|uniref:alpha/beta fold hydrolase n=1 Tax=Cupriavidus pauculus TaxID=82633 RepID=UPI0030F50E0E
MNVLLVLVLAVAAAGAALLALLFVFTWRTTRKIEAALPPTGRFVDVPGTRLHVVERGNGPAVLLVHGLSGQLANFDYGMIEPLSRDFRVIAVDRPGAGYSTRQPGAAADLRAQADTLAALIDQLGLHKPLVVGHSLGGAISLALATYHPDRVGGLALIAPLTHPPEAVSPVFQAMAVQSAFVRKLIAWTLVIPMSIRRREQVMNIVFGPDAVPADFPTRGGGLLALRPSHFIGASEDLLGVAHSLPPLLPRYSDLRVPVSILFGREDRILDYRMNGEAFVAKLPAARLTLVNGGHMLPVTAVQTSVDFVRDAALQLHEAVAA